MAFTVSKFEVFSKKFKNVDFPAPVSPSIRKLQICFDRILPLRCSLNFIMFDEGSGFILIAMEWLMCMLRLQIFHILQKLVQFETTGQIKEYYSWFYLLQQPRTVRLKSARSFGLSLFSGFLWCPPSVEEILELSALGCVLCRCRRGGDDNFCWFPWICSEAPLIFFSFLCHQTFSQPLVSESEETIRNIIR